MKVEMKCFADLSRRYDCAYDAYRTREVRDGSTVGSLLNDAAIDAGHVRVVFVNGRSAPAERKLGDGDRVALVPPTGGM